MHFLLEGQAGGRQQSLAGQIDHQHIVAALLSRISCEVKKILAERIPAANYEDHRPDLIVLLQIITSHGFYFVRDFDRAYRHAQ